MENVKNGKSNWDDLDFSIYKYAYPKQFFCYVWTIVIISKAIFFHYVWAKSLDLKANYIEEKDILLIICIAYIQSNFYIIYKQKFSQI